MNSAPNLEDPEFLELLAACISGFTEKGATWVETILEQNPKYRDLLRERLRALEGVGLLGSASETLPDSFGPYTIVKRIGSGGMSEVLLARDSRMGRVVALKCSHPGLVLEDRTRERFQREVQAIAKLSHPAIVPIFDVGESEGRAYFTMEYVEGATLANVLGKLRSNEAGLDRIERGACVAQCVGAEDPQAPIWQVPYVELVCGWVLALAEALVHAHQAGVVHRDVNPANVMVRPDGRAQLLDFGLAQMHDAPALTRLGEFTGTPYYVSPEQVGGKVEGQAERCDVYSMGVTLYELLTLKRPFDGESTAEVLDRIQRAEPIAPRQIAHFITRDLELICLKAIDRDRGHRYGSMADFAADLRRLLAFEPVAARPLGSLRRCMRFAKRRPGMATAIGFLLVLLAGFPPALIGVNAKIRKERNAALEASKRSEQLAEQIEEFMVGLLETARFEGPSVSVEELVAREIDQLALPAAETDPDVQIALLAATGRLYRELGAFGKAHRLLNRAVSRRRLEIGGSSPLLAKSLLHLGDVTLRLGDAQGAHGQATEGIEILDGLELVEAGLRADLLMLLGDADLALERPVESGEHSAKVLALLDDGHSITNEAVLRLGSIAIQNQRWEQAASALGMALARAEAAWVVAPSALKEVRGSYALALDQIGEAQGARDQRRAVEVTDQRLAKWDTLAASSLPAIELDFRFTSWRKGYREAAIKAWECFPEGRFDEARQHLLAGLEFYPRDVIMAFNLACLESSVGNVDAAIEWLEKAIDFGYGSVPQFSVTTLRFDGDLGTAREDARFDGLLERARLLASEPRPSRVHELGEVSEGTPLVVHLLASGASLPRDADPLFTGFEGTVLSIIAPSATGPGNPGWLGGEGEFAHVVKGLGELVEDSLRLRISALQFDRARVFMVAEGDAGPVASDLAISHAGLFRGLVLVDSFVLAQPRGSALREAVLAGLRIEVVDRADRDVEWVPKTSSQAELNRSVADWFAGMGFDVGRHEVEEGVAATELVHQLLR